MARILVLGHELSALAKGPVEARSYRTWQFVDAALRDHHELCLVVNHEHEERGLAHSLDPRLTYHRLNMRRRGWVRRLNDIHNEFQPDGILSVMFNSCLRASRIRTKKPLWMDIYGDKLAETQIAEFANGNDRGRRNLMHYLRIVLRAGDVFSTCGTPQKFAMVGQLAMTGRLNRHTTGYEMVHAVLPGAAARAQTGEPHTAATVRGTLVPENAFVVLWAGGYNVWIDPDTLYQALDEAMDRDPNIYFLSVGASTAPRPDGPYERFCARIERSSHRARYILRGWQPASALSAYYRNADVGITLDAFHYETLLGTRTRLIEMMNHNLPVITTLGCELSEIIRDQGLGLTFEIGDAGTFREHILRMARDVDLRRGMGARAREYASQQLSFTETTRRFLEWARAPYHAPDHAAHPTLSARQNVEYLLRHVARLALWHGFALESGE